MGGAFDSDAFKFQVKTAALHRYKLWHEAAALKPQRSLSPPTQPLPRPARSLSREARLRLPLRVLKQARFVVSLVAGHVDDEVPFDVLGLGAIASKRER